MPSNSDTDVSPTSVLSSGAESERNKSTLLTREINDQLTWIRHLESGKIASVNRPWFKNALQIPSKSIGERLKHISNFAFGKKHPNVSVPTDEQDDVPTLYFGESKDDDISIVYLSTSKDKVNTKDLDSVFYKSYFHPQSNKAVTTDDGDKTTLRWPPAQGPSRQDPDKPVPQKSITIHRRQKADGRQKISAVMLGSGSQDAEAAAKLVDLLKSKGVRKARLSNRLSKEFREEFERLWNTPGLAAVNAADESDQKRKKDRKRNEFNVPAENNGGQPPAAADNSDSDDLDAIAMPALAPADTAEHGNAGKLPTTTQRLRTQPRVPANNNDNDGSDLKATERALLRAQKRQPISKNNPITRRKARHKKRPKNVFDADNPQADNRPPPLRGQSIFNNNSTPGPNHPKLGGKHQAELAQPADAEPGQNDLGVQVYIRKDGLPEVVRNPQVIDLVRAVNCDNGGKPQL